MKKLSFKNVSLLSLVLMGASAVTAAVLPGKTSASAPNNGTLRIFSATAAGADQDPLDEAIVSCIPDVDTAYSCTATAVTGTTTGAGTSRDGLGRNTVGNTSITNGISGEQTSAIG